MSSHKFAIGQFVDFERNTAPISRARGPYEVTQVLPVDRANFPTYRIKSKVEPFERAASEHELVSVGLPPAAAGALCQLTVNEMPASARTSVLPY